MRLGASGSIDLACIDVTAISVSKALLWHCVEVRSSHRVDSLACLGEQAAVQLAADIYGFVNSHLFDLIASESDRLAEVDARLLSITEHQRQYLAHADLAKAIAAVPGKSAAALSHPLFDPEMMSSDLRAELPASLAFLTDASVRHRYNDEFASAELDRYRSFFDDLDGRSLSDQQREACIRLEDNNLLVASAGSGKSATMIGKVAYVLDKQLHRPEEILVLAFNRSAAEELKERIARQLGVEAADLKCRVTTFHALGRGIIEETEGRPPQLADWVEHPAGEAKVIEQIIADLLSSDPEFAKLWIDLLVLHPKADIPAEVIDTEADRERYLSVRRRRSHATIGTLAGTYVKSLQEQTIVNWLWLHSVEFEYERQIAIEDENGAIRHLHPDFYYPASQTIHEHLAINADGSSPFADYIGHAESKRAAYRKAGLDVFETTSAQASKGSLVAELEAELAKRSIPFRRKSYSAIVQALEPVVIKHYRCNQLIAETAASFVQRNPAQLKKSVRSARPAIARSIRVIPIERDRGKPDFGEACNRLLKRLDDFLGGISGQWRTDDRQKLKVMVLWRYNQLDPFQGATPHLEHIEILGHSFHRAKGLEADYTILLDVSEGDYPAVAALPLGNVGTTRHDHLHDNWRNRAGSSLGMRRDSGRRKSCCILLTGQTWIPSR